MEGNIICNRQNPDWADNFQPGLVSIIIPTFDRADMVAELAAALLGQTWPKVEIIIIDDGSRDDTVRRIEAINVPRHGPQIMLLQQANAGPAAARNYGLHHATGEYILFFDSDDLLANDAISVLVATIEESDCDYGLGIIAQGNIDGIVDPMNPLFRPEQVPGNIIASHWPTISALYHRAVIGRAGFFDQRLLMGEDTEFHWRVLATSGSGQIVDTVLGVRRLHDGGQISMDRTTQKIRQDVVRVHQCFFEWAVAHDALTDTICLATARNCLISGVYLGHVGDWEGNKAAFELIRLLGQHRQWWGPIVSFLGRPQSQCYHSALWFSFLAVRRLARLSGTGLARLRALVRRCLVTVAPTSVR